MVCYPTLTFHYEVWSLVNMTSELGRSDSALSYFYRLPCDVCGSFGGNGLPGVKYQSLPIQFQSLAVILQGRIGLGKSIFHRLPLLRGIESIEYSNHDKSEREDQLYPLKERVAFKEYHHRVGWVMLISGVVSAFTGVCFLGFCPALPTRTKAVIFAGSGMLLIVLAWFSIHRGLDLLYTQ